VSAGHLATLASVAVTVVGGQSDLRAGFEGECEKAEKNQ